MWLNRSQIAKLFDRDIKTIGKHINNVLNDELNLFVFLNNINQAAINKICKKCSKKSKAEKSKIHGMTNTKLYGVWNGMINRCENPNTKAYKDYGKKGISVCEEWHNSSNFFEWAIKNGYKEGLQIDRINTQGNYCAENCRWVDRIQNANNKTNNKYIEYNGETVIVSRTGYTGEDGFEIYGSHTFTNEVWDKLLASGEVKPCGLGCRDTLRFEVGLPLYGDELADDITPLEAGLGMFVKLEKDFIGKEALVKQKAEGLKRKIVGVELKDKAIPRHGYDVEVDGNVVGVVTTGYNSISTGKSVCMAMLDIDYTKLGTEVAVRIRKKVFPGVVTKKRFYDKNYKK